MTSFIRKEYRGNVPTTATLNGSILNDSATITLSSGTGFPDGSVGSFVVTLDQGKAAEEKVLCVSRSGVVLTVATSPAGRGWDGTVATGHDSGAPCVHTIDADSLDGANLAVVNTVGRVAALGDLLVGSGANALAKLAIGATGKVLGVSGGTAAWVNSAQSVVTTAGDLLVATGSAALARLGIGSTGQVLTVAGGTAVWATPSAGLLASISYSPNPAVILTVTPVLPLLTGFDATNLTVSFTTTASGAGSTAVIVRLSATASTGGTGASQAYWALITHGTTTDVGNTTVYLTDSSAQATYTRDILVSGLSPSTTYHWDWAGSDLNGSPAGSALLIGKGASATTVYGPAVIEVWAA